jgi:hypothetical protein
MSKFHLFDRIQFESDSKLLVDAIYSRRSGNSEFHLIINDIILHMTSSHENFEVNFVRRQANLIARTLSRAVKFWTNFHRFDIIIEHLLINDIN